MLIKCEKKSKIINLKPHKSLFFHNFLYLPKDLISGKGKISNRLLWVIVIQIHWNPMSVTKERKNQIVGNKARLTNALTFIVKNFISIMNYRKLILNFPKIRSSNFVQNANIFIKKCNFVISVSKYMIRTKIQPITKLG